MAAATIAALALTACVPGAARRGSLGVETALRDRGNTQIVGIRLDSARSLPAIPTGSVSLDSVTRLALVRSPQMRAVLAEVGLAAADLWQASRLPNPTIDANYGFPKSGGEGLTEFGVGFSIISALQTPLRKRVATAELASAELHVADAVYGGILDVQRAYVTVQYAQQMLELRQSVASVTAASANVAKALFNAGNLPAVTVAAEEAMAAETAVMVPVATGELTVARAALGRLMGAGIADTLWAIDDRLAEPTTAPWSLAVLDTLAISRRMDIASAREAVAAAAAAVGLSSRFRFLPDGTIGAAFERGPDGQFFGPSASLTLPLFDQGGAGVARARAMLAQRVAVHDGVIVNTHAEVQSAIAEIESARQRSLQLRTVVLPLRRRVVAETQLQVNAMAMPVFALLQARQSEIDAGQMYLDALRDYWFARAALERAIGGPLPVGNTP